jgi:hypothetical protein
MDHHYGKRTPEHIYREIHEEPDPEDQDPGDGPDPPQNTSQGPDEGIGVPHQGSEESSDQQTPQPNPPSAPDSGASASGDEDQKDSEDPQDPPAAQPPGIAPGTGTDALELQISSDNWGAIIPPLDLTFDEITEREAEIQTSLTEARIIAQSMGEHHGFQETDIPIRPLDFRMQLAGFIKKTGLEKCDYTWNRPARRYLGCKLIMPDTAAAPKNDQLWVAIDTSGSVSEDMLKRFLDTLSSLLMEYRGVTITIIQCDTQVHDMRTFTHADLPIKDIPIYGRGGTDFNPVFDKINNERLPVTALLYFTDLGVWDRGIPANAPTYPVAWIDFTGNQVPYYTPHFGTILTMND